MNISSSVSKFKNALNIMWVINFVDIFNIAFAIYGENVEYNLIKMNDDDAEDKSMAEWEDYRVFSQIKRQQK